MKHLADIAALVTKTTKENPKLARLLLTIATLLIAGVVAKLTGLPIRDLVSVIWSMLALG